MARPKSDDPTVPVPLRIRRSAHDWWEREATRLNIKVPKLMQRVLDEKAMRAIERSGPKTYVDNPGFKESLDGWTEVPSELVKPDHVSPSTLGAERAKRLLTNPKDCKHPMMIKGTNYCGACKTEVKRK